MKTGAEGSNGRAAKMNGLMQSPRTLLHRTQMVFLVASIIPLVVLAYLFVQYIFPILGSSEFETLVTSIYVTLAFTIILTVLGYIMTRRTTLASIEAIQRAEHLQ